MEIPAALKNLHNWVQMSVVIVLSLILAALLARIYMQTLSGVAVIVRVFALQIVLVGVCVGIDSLLDSRYPMIFAIVTTGIVTVYAVLLHFLRLAPDGRLQDADIRIAIALSTTLVYLMLVGYGVFLADEKMGEFAKTLTTSFTSIVGVVVAFYFGASAYVETKRAATHINRTAETSRDTAQELASQPNTQTT